MAFVTQLPWTGTELVMGATERGKDTKPPSLGYETLERWTFLSLENQNVSLH